MNSNIFNAIGLGTSDPAVLFIIMIVLIILMIVLVIVQNKKFKAHDESNACGVGDTVRIMETRPISKDKHWRIVEIIEKAK